MNEWKIQEIGPQVHVINFTGIKAGWNQKVLLTGDRHHDNRLSVHKLEKEHLDQAKKINAPVIDLGDLFCLMQGKWDPRRSQKGMRPEHQDDDYLNRVMDTTEEFYAPYADIFAIMGYGNHEMAHIKHHNFDATKDLARRLKSHATREDTANVGGYGGWVMFRFDGGKRQAMRLKYHHGHGGGGPVTKGIIQTNRRAVYLPDADIVVSAHIHESWQLALKRDRLSRKGTQYHDIQWHISVPTYKEEYGPGGEGFHIETGRPPKPLGCVWLDFKYNPKNRSRRIKMSVEMDST